VTCRPLPVRLSRVVWVIALRAHRRQATYLFPALLALGLALTVVLAGPAAGEPPQIAAKRAEAQQVLDEIRSLDSQLEGAIEAYNGATNELTRIEAQRALNTRHLGIAKNNLAIAQRRLADRLRAMYTQPQEDSTLAILLGARSLSEFLDSVETVDSVASQDTQVIGEIKRFKRDVTLRAAFLKKAQARQEQIVAERAAAKREIEAGLAERQRLVESIKGEIARLQAEEEARQVRLAAEAQRRLQAELAAQKEEV
jgi:peptidoglycan DL-endopeptidase CwlO